MTNDGNGPKRFSAPEILPPIPQSVSLAPEVTSLPQGFLGMSLFARARYASEQKQFEAYTRLVSAKNALVRALTEQRILTVQYVEASEEVRNLDDVRERARLRMRAEMGALRQSADLAELRFETEKARLEYERDRYRKMRDDVNAPKERATDRPKKSMADAFKEVGGEIDQLIESFNEYRAERIRKAGGEENLTDEERRRFTQWELVINNHINDAMAGVG
jgi:hypothetical protein